MQLESFVTRELFFFLLVFVRIGAGVMFMPGVAELYVPMRVRLLFAVACTLAIVPMVQPMLPAEIPNSPLSLTVLLTMEIITGSFIGLLARMITATMHIAGMIISFQSSLSSATMFDMTQASQGTGFGNFLSMTAVVLLFATNMHHLILQGLFDSYTIFPAGMSVPIGDMADHLTRLLSDVFLMGMKIASPLLVIGTVIFVGMGILARLMPNMQVFFIIAPPQILASFAIVMMGMSGIMLWYLDFAEARLAAFLGR
jgi:flagellar biosynthetic protein FliR